MSVAKTKDEQLNRWQKSVVVKAKERERKIGSVAVCPLTILGGLSPPYILGLPGLLALLLRLTHS